MSMTKEQGIAFIAALPEGEPFTIIRPRELAQKRREAVRKFSFQCTDSQKEALCTLYDAFVDSYGKSEGIDRWIRCLSEELIQTGADDGP
jgi:hypothetical protein